jgi:hypothetical protein
MHRLNGRVQKLEHQCQAPAPEPVLSPEERRARIAALRAKGNIPEHITTPEQLRQFLAERRGGDAS